MAETGRVIDGFERCLDDDCDNCPYYDPEVSHDCDYFGRCLRETMYRDAITLLKEAREDRISLQGTIVKLTNAIKENAPRVMTLDEVIEHYSLPNDFGGDLDMQEDFLLDIQPLYFEFPNPCAWDVHWRGANQVRQYLDVWRSYYGKTWRCWTDRPTDAQKEATAWE